MRTPRGPWQLLALCAALAPCAPRAAESEAATDYLAGAPEGVLIEASRADAAQAPDSASSGVVSAAQLESRPLMRTGELLEAVPGLIVTQHSGDGKANQYFLRGFDLDHGTDFATSVDGMPVNMPTHAHGQGYSDLNFLIPELVDQLVYRKGPYYADQGDFSAAGAAELTLARRLDRNLLSASAGEYGYRHVLAAASAPLAAGDLLVAAQAQYQNGPWQLPEGYRKLAGVLKYTSGDAAGGLALESLLYAGRWRSSDQIPQRAVEDGRLARFGTVDPTDGGRTHRYSLSAAGWRAWGSGELRASLYAIDYFLDLFSDFTYFLDPVHGDQFEQYDRRHVYGGSLGWQQPLAYGALSAGLELRDDEIDPVALYDTTARARWKTVSTARVSERHEAAFLSWSASPTPWWRTELGARFDALRFRVAADLAANSGIAHAGLVSPKATFVFGPWTDTAYFVNFGRGFHSNDARGTTLNVDPNDGVTPAAKVSPVARAWGTELGARTSLIPKTELAVSLWTLKLDSELTLDNDASAIVPSAATRRYGVEIAATCHPWEFVRVDADLALTHARYIDVQAAGQYLPNSLPQVGALAVTLSRDLGWFGAAQLRYFGAAPVTQDDTVRSRPSLRVSLEAGYRFSGALSGTLSVHNLLDRRDDDIEYYYASRLRGEPAPVEDLHFHPAEPRTLRLSVSYRL